ncbi:Non-histone chromosomal protein 6 [Basidiobolus ranarum]|uniref:Non-histone chromosomal protein 6 n=1 Tax=Basidiobolus ranarum TaxID=34480 RepID=A0ABR2W7I6_9FUNG
MEESHSTISPDNHIKGQQEPTQTKHDSFQSVTCKAKSSKKSSYSSRKQNPTKVNKEKCGPKKPRSAYIMFTINERPRLSVEYPKASATRLLKLLGAKWKTLSDIEKKPYDDMAQRDKLRYEAEKRRHHLGCSPETINLSQEFLFQSDL